MHDCFLRFVNPEGVVASRGTQEVREQRSYPWRTLAKRLQEGRDAGVPKSDAKAVVQVWDEYVDALYEQSSGNPNPGSAA